MLTRPKNKIYNPKVNAIALEPLFVKDVLADSKWLDAMKDEYTALMGNKTWFLVPLPLDCSAIGCKWVFHVKYNSDGSILKYKACLLAKGFYQ